MTAPINLIPLVCVRCKAPVPAGVDETAWLCSECGQGLLLNDDTGLSPIDIKFSHKIANHQVGRPFWIALGQVQVDRSSSEFLSGQTEEAQAFWAAPKQFFIPAFDCDLEQMLAISLHYLREPVQLKPGAAVPFHPVIFSQKDVTSLVEYIIVAVEAKRKDKVKNIHFDLQLELPELWILPPE